MQLAYQTLSWRRYAALRKCSSDVPVGTKHVEGVVHGTTTSNAVDNEQFVNFAYRAGVVEL